MTAYALAHEGLFKNLIVTTHPNLEAAKAHLDSVRALGGFAVEREVDVDCKGFELVALYNALVAIKASNEGSPEAKPVNKFTTKADGQRRSFALIEELFQYQAPTVAAPPTVVDEAAISTETTTEGEDMATKGKKVKAAKAPREKKAVKEKKDRSYKAKVVSKGSEDRKASALELIQRKNGATAQEIADKFKLSLGSAKNLVWYLRRDGHKITVDKTSDRKPYVI